MWSGEMPGPGEAYPTQWALNPSSQYLHMPHEQVDWASLAQQWIKMKEETPQIENEQGEAPMDITKEDAVPPAPATLTAAPDAVTPVINPPTWPTTQIPTGSDSSSWWGWSQTGAGTGTWPITGAPYTEATVPPEAVAPTYPYTATATPAPEYTPPPPNLSNYWNEVGLSIAKEETPSWEGRNNRKHSNHQVPEPTPEIDAVKRKQLPAWIREGLEKMEREKMKKAESERLERERKEALLNKPQGAEETTKVNVDGNGYEEPPKSKFETDSSESEAEEKDNKATEDPKPRKSRFDIRQPSPPKPVLRTKEQILQYVMIDVRKFLTQILMEVTSEEIQKACEEVHRHYSRKAPATTLRKTQALTSLTGKLGLGIYGSDSESEDSGSEKVTNDPDSDQELKEKIERLKSEFASTEKSIEREYLEQEEREKRQLLRERRESSEEGDHSQVHSHPPRGIPMEKTVDPHASKVVIQSEDSHPESTIVQGESRGRVDEGRSPAIGGRVKTERGGIRSEKGESRSEKGESRTDRGGSRSKGGGSRSERGGSRSERGGSRNDRGGGSSRKKRRRSRSTSSSSSSETSSTSSSSSSSSDSSSRRRRKRRRHNFHHRRHHRHRSSSRSSSSPHRHSRHHRRVYSNEIVNITNL